MTIKVSVILPAHNAAEYVSSAVKSALGQTLREIEVIVIDDASTDLTASSAFDAAGGDTRLVMVRCQTNGGPSVARNIGLERAKGKWVALLDADDTFAPARLESMLNLAEATEADLLADNLIVATGSDSPDGKGALPEEFMSKTNPITAEEFITWDRPALGLGSVGFMKPLMRTEFLRAHRLMYNPQLRISEDFHFYVSCLLLGARMHVTPHAWYRYLFRSDSQCRGMEARYQEQLIEGNVDLERIAIACHQEAALTKLQERREELHKWVPYFIFVTLLRGRKMVPAIKQFSSLPSRTYALRQLIRDGLRRIPAGFS